MLLVVQISSIQYRKLDFEEFCAAAISVHQLEGMETWEQHARRAYELFEKDGNRPIMIEELASVRTKFSTRYCTYKNNARIYNYYLLRTHEGIMLTNLSFLANNQLCFLNIYFQKLQTLNKTSI